MNKLDLESVKKFINTNISGFHNKRLESLSKLKLNSILKRKNPYLFRAKNILTASDLIAGFMEAHLSSSEEKLFGDFLENLALFIAGKTCDGKKSSATGIDIEFQCNDVSYLISVKSGV